MFFFIVYGMIFPITEGKLGIKPQVAPLNSKIILVWQEYSPKWGSDIFFQIRTRDGKKIECTGIINEDTCSFNQSSPHVASANDIALVVWEDGRSGSSTDIYAQFFDENGKTGKNFRVDDDTTGKYHIHPHATFVPPEKLFIVWQDLREGNYDIYGQWIDHKGNFIGKNICISNSSDWEYMPIAVNLYQKVFTVWQYVSDGIYCIKGKYISPEQKNIGNEISITGRNRILLSVLVNDEIPFILWKDYNTSFYSLFDTKKKSSHNLREISPLSAFATYWQDTLFFFWVEKKGEGSCLLYQVKNSNSVTLVERKKKEIYNLSGFVSNDTFYLVWIEASKKDSSWDIHLGIFIGKRSAVENIAFVEDITIERFHLYPPSPNPFREQAVIKFDVPIPSKVNVAIYDELGRKVATLTNKDYIPGTYSLTWDGRSSTGRMLPSGSYFCVLKSGEYRNCKKLILIK